VKKQDDSSVFFILIKINILIFKKILEALHIKLRLAQESSMSFHLWVEEVSKKLGIKKE